MRILLLALLAFVTGCSGCVSTPAPPDPHTFALRLEFEGGLCSGTAYSDDVKATTTDDLVSAAHCFGGGIGKLVSVNGVHVDSYHGVSLKGDSIRVHVPGMHFKSFARGSGKARQGDRVTWYGNPLGAADMLRQGYVSGIVQGNYIIAAATCVGDSGSGIFNERGELIAIVSKIPTPTCSPFVLAVPV